MSTSILLRDLKKALKCLMLIYRVQKNEETSQSIWCLLHMILVNQMLVLKKRKKYYKNFHFLKQIYIFHIFTNYDETIWQLLWFWITFIPDREPYCLRDTTALNTACSPSHKCMTLFFFYIQLICNTSTIIQIIVIT